MALVTTTEMFKKAYDGGYATDNVLASYLHLNFAGSDEGAQHFVDICANYKAKRS